MWSNVHEQITDGTSGLAPKGQPTAVIVGSSSKGSFINPIPIGKTSDIPKELGIGEMPRRLQDMQKTMADVSVIAVRSEADISGKISPVQGNEHLSIIGEPIGSSITKINVSTAGELGQAELFISIRGDVSYESYSIVPQDGIILLENLSISLVFPENFTFNQNMTWSFETQAPTSSFINLEKAIDSALELYTPEFLFVAQDINSEYATLFANKAETLFEDHKPVLFLLESNLRTAPSISEAASLKIQEFKKTSGRFISVICQEGFVLTKYGKEFRSPSGLCAGHITKAHPNQSIGATNFFPISNYEISPQWNNTISRTLDEANFITLRTYAGLENYFWSNGRTFAPNNSDYRYIEVVRTVFKAIRLARNTSLKYIHSNGDTVGVQNLISEVRNSINTMVEKNPKELDNVIISTPDNMDVANNGVTLNIELFGIPIIRNIILNFMFKYQKNK